MYAIKADSSVVIDDLKELSKNSSGKITEENLTNVTREILGDDYTVTYNSSDKQFEISSNSGNGETIIIKEDENIVETGNEETPRNLITAAMVKSNASTYYGKNVNYLPIVTNYDSNTSVNLSGWKVFYADDNNIYLISENFINCNIIPGNSAGNRPHYVLSGNNAGSSPKVNFDNYDLLMSYSGSDAITSSNPARPWLNQYYNNNFYS